MSSKLMKKTSLITAGAVLASTTATYGYEIPSEFYSEPINVIYPPTTNNMQFGDTNGWIVRPDTIESNYKLTIDSRLLQSEIEDVSGVKQILGCWTDDSVQLPDDSPLLQPLTFDSVTSSTNYDGDKMVLNMGAPADAKKQWFQVKITFLTGDTYSYISPVFNNSSEVMASTIRVEKDGILINNIQGKTGESLAVDVNVGPAEALDKGYTVESSNPDVVTADTSGNITFVGNGSANLTYKLSSSPNIKHTISVNVGTAVVKDLKISLNGSDYSADNKNILNGSNTLNVESYDTDGLLVAGDAKVVPQDTSILSVDESGNIVAKSLGTDTIRVYSQSNNSVYKDIQIQVVNSLVELQGISLASLVTRNVYVGDTLEVEVLFNPANYPVKDLTLNIVDPAIMTHSKTEINSAGNPVLTFDIVGEGSTTSDITTVAQNNSGSTFSTELSVNASIKKPVTGVEVNTPNLEVGKGGELDLGGLIVVKPSDASIKDVIYEVDDDTVLTVDETGKVTGVTGGTANVTITSKDDPSISVTVPIKVTVATGSVIPVGSGTINLVVGDTEDVSSLVSVTPSDATNKELTYTVNDTGIATVDSTGKLTAVAKGSTTITVASKENPAKNCTFIVNVSDLVIPITGITVNGDSNLSYKVDDSDNLSNKITVNPAGYTENLTWVTSDNKVATVDTNGQLVIVGAGNCTITVTGGSQSATINITASPNIVNVESIQADENVIALKEGTSANVSSNFSVLPADATNKVLSYEIVDTDIATVDNSGLVVAKKVGTTSLTVKTTDGTNISRTITIEVTKDTVDISGVSINGSNKVNVDKGNVVDLGSKVVITPDTATNKDLVWSSNNGCVTVDSSGKVTGVANGTATITGTTTDGSNISVSFEVTVSTPSKPELITKLDILNSKLNLRVGDVETLGYIIEPATNKNFKWTTSNSGVVSVLDGVVKGLKEGYATITLEATDASGLKDSIDVYVDAIPQVTIPLNSISFSKALVNMNVGYTVSLPVIVANPVNTTVDLSGVTYSSDDESVVRVVNGELQAVGRGNAIVTATINGKTAELVVMVKQPITTFEIVEDSIDVIVGENYTLNYTIEPTDYDGKIIWTSSDNNIATVSNTGRITAIKEGAVEITGKTSDGKIVDTVLVQTKPLVIIETGFDINQSKIIVAQGMEVPLSWKFTPANTTQVDVTWTSTNDGIASVSNKGIVTANTIGTVIVTGETVNGHIDFLEVEVVDKIDVDGYNPAFIEYIDQEIELLKGERKAVNYSINNDASFQAVLWSSSNDSIATVDDNGIVTGVNQGVTTVEVQTYDSTLNIQDINATTGSAISLMSSRANMGSISYVTTKVISKVSSIVTDIDATELTIGESKSVGYEIYPLDATNKNVIITSDNPAIVKIEGGNIVGVGKGFTTVWVTTEDGNFKDRMTVFVKEAPVEPDVLAERIDLDKGNYTIVEGQKGVINYTVLPLNATDNSVTFTVGDSSIATVDENGKISGVKAGTTTVEVISKANTNVKATAVITVEKAPITVIPVTGVSVGVGNLSLNVGDTHRLQATVYPINASNKNVTYKSLDSNIVTVNSVGDIIAKASGSTQVVVTTQDGGFQAIINVTVSGGTTSGGDNGTNGGTNGDNTSGGNSNGSNDSTNGEDTTTVIKPNKDTPITSISVNNSQIFIREGETLNVSSNIKVSPSNASKDLLKYSSKNSEIAKVTYSGNVTGVKEGRTIIEVQSKGNSNLYEVIEVIVLPKLDKEKAQDLSKEEFSKLIPFTLPTGLVDIAKLFNVKTDNLKISAIDVKNGVHSVSFEYKSDKYESKVKGVTLDGKVKQYSDVKKSHWAYNSIESATKIGYLEGVSEFKYEPKNKLNYQDTFTSLNRVLMAKQVYSVKTSRSVVEGYLTKLGDKHWAYYDLGSILMKLDSNLSKKITSYTEFNTKAITRGELAEVLMGITDKLNLPATKQIVVYGDLTEVGTAIDYVTRNGLMQGDNKGNFNKNATLTRAELATVLLRLNSLIK